MMRNRVVIVVERSGSIKIQKKEKDFSGVLNQYYDYEKTRSQYYHLFGTGLLFLTLMGLSIYFQWQTDLKPQTSPLSSSLVSHAIMGPVQSKIVNFPKLILPNHQVEEKSREIDLTNSQSKVEKLKIDTLNVEENQSETPIVEREVVDRYPAEPINGYQHLYEYFYSNLTYPNEFLADSIQGIVKVAFTINADSSVSNLQIIQSLGPAFDQEAIRLVKSMPQWKPAEINGLKVPSDLIIPLRYKMKKDE